MGYYKSFVAAVSACCMVLAATGCTAGQAGSPAATEASPTTESVAAEPAVTPENTAGQRSMEQPDLAQLVDTYGNLGLVDAHNHDASGKQFQRMEESWAKYKMRNVVLFGDVSERSAVLTDSYSWHAYQSNPDLYIPYFSGFDLHDPECLKVIKDNLEQGYFGLGEIAAASTYSPALAHVEWKADSPMDGYFPEIYDLIAEYKAPILLHIDPPNGEPVAKLEQALSEHPDTIFIFAHINAYNTPEEIDRLMGRYPNLYADFLPASLSIILKGAAAGTLYPCHSQISGPLHAQHGFRIWTGGRRGESH